MSETEAAENEPVKVKMTLRRARPSIQGAAEPRLAAAAAVEAVEARWRDDEAKCRAQSHRKTLVSFLSWFLLLFVGLGFSWFFLGEKYLPAEYAFPVVQQKVLEFWNAHFGTK